MLVDLRQIEDVQRKFTELGQAISEMTDRSDDLFQETLGSFEEYKEVVLTFVSGGTLESLKGTADEVDRQQFGLAGVYSELSSGSKEAFRDFSETMQEGQKWFDGVGDVSKKVSKSAAKLEVSKAGKQAKMESRGEVAKGKPKEAGKDSLATQEMKSLKSQVGGMLTRLKLPVPGKILAGSLVWMAFGFQREDRLRAQAGEVINTVVTMYDGGVKRMVNQATEYIAGLQEKLQLSYGIARSETQGVLKAFAEGGLSAESAIDKVDKSLGMVGESNVAFALAIDKMQELAGGTSAQRMVSYMADYGKTLEEARETTGQLIAAGRESGIGTMQFVKNIETAAGTLKQFGFDIDEVIDLSRNLQGMFEKMGVPKQFAGRQAALGLMQMASSIAGMSNEWKMMVSEKMYSKEGLKGIEAIQKMEEGFVKIAKGQNKDEWFEVIKSLREIAMTAAQGDETLAKHILRKGLGIPVEGVNAIVKIGESLESGSFKQAGDLLKNHMSTLQNSFLTERQRTSKWQLHMNEWMDTVAKLGQGMLSVTVNILATLVALTRALPQMLINWWNEDKAANYRIADTIKGFTDGMSDSMSNIGRDLLDLASKGKEMGMDVLGPAARNLVKASSFDPMSTGPGPSARGLGGTERGNIQRQFETPTGTTQVRVVTVPVQVGGEGGAYEVPVAEMYAGGEGGDVRLSGETEQWVGGQLSFVTTEVDQMGNIGISLQGNCPSCGLIYGDVSMTTEGVQGSSVFSTQDEETLARMLRSEMGTDAFVGARKTEAVGIAHTVLNRMKSGRKKYAGKSLHDVVTGGHGYGEQVGSYRPYATARKATPATRKLAREILSGRHADPTGGATQFYHSTGGKGYGKKGSAPSERTVMPKFTRESANTFNINNASFWGSTRSTTQRAENADAWRKKEHEKYAARRGFDPKSQLKTYEPGGGLDFGVAQQQPPPMLARPSEGPESGLDWLTGGEVTG